MNNLAATAWGTYQSEPPGWNLVPYQGSVYFSVYNDGTSDPGKVYRYNPASGLSTVTETTGRFTTMKEVGGLLYIADSLGGVSTYDGHSVGTLPLPAPEFNSTSYVGSMTELNGQMFLGTSSGNVYQYGQQAPVYSAGNHQISDICAWNGSLYVSTGGVAGNVSSLVKSNGSNLGSWSTTLSGVFNGSDIFLPTSGYLYATPTDNEYWHDSTIRRTSDGLHWTTIAGPGPFKFPLGSPMVLGNTAYFFENGSPYDYTGGYLITDDGTTTTGPTDMSGWNYRVYAATSLNGQVYGLASDHDQGYNYSGNVYLLTTPEPSAVPEPSALIVWSLLGGLAVGLGWWRKRNAA